ncbi:hypothetical protein BC827DRAFT_715802 [Russula dissimulans]|nr:hypothetical protein BC827DRAFT_715802 [Russula dissimulans]
MPKRSAFLKNPTKEEEDKVSKVFYCRYNMGRLVEKSGRHCDNDESECASRGIGSKAGAQVMLISSIRTQRQAEPLCHPLPWSMFPPPLSPPHLRPTEWFSAKKQQYRPRCFINIVHDGRCEICA